MPADRKFRFQNQKISIDLDRFTISNFKFESKHYSEPFIDDVTIQNLVLSSE